jgi:hypothetical protein
MPLGRYDWSWTHHLHLTAVDYEEVSITASPTGFTHAKVKASQFGMVRFSGGGFRAIWTPNAASLVTDSFGTIFWDNTYDIFTRLEMLQFQAVLNSGATSGLLQIHYYAPPVGPEPA